MSRRETVNLIDADGHGHFVPSQNGLGALPCASARMAVRGCGRAEDALRERLGGLRLPLVGARRVIAEPARRKPPVPTLESEPTPYPLADGHGESVQFKEDFAGRLWKSSDVGNGRVAARKHVLVTQRHTGEDTAKFGEAAPRIWEYLNGRAFHFDNRASSVYRGQPRFAMLGIGPYSFAPWRVAISGFYDSLRFPLVSPAGRASRDGGRYLVLPSVRSSRGGRTRHRPPRLAARAAISEIPGFPDAKRPVTIDMLRRISIDSLARHLDRFDDLRELGGQSALHSDE